MKQQNSSKNSMDTASIIFTILLFITMIIVIVIELAIILSYVMTSRKGRCVFINSDNDCECKFTNKKSCDDVNGVFNGNLSCDDGFDLVCKALEDTTKVPQSH